MTPQPSPHNSGSAPVDHSHGRVARALALVRDLGPRELFRRIRKGGFSGTTAFIKRNIRHQIAHRHALAFDRREGLDTAGSIQLDALDVVGPNKTLGNEAVSTSPRSFEWLIGQAPIPQGSVFIDLGCGKGRTVLLASHRFDHCIGVEFARELVAVARGNLAHYARKHTDIGQVEILCEDAGAYRFPDQPVVVYFYNPFGEVLFRRVLSNLVKRLAASGKPCTLVYATGMGTLDWAHPAVMETAAFRLVQSGRTPGFADAVRRLDYAIYTLA